MSTLCNKLSKILEYPQDTIVVLTKDISQHRSENSFIPYLPVLSVIIGALLAFLVQYLIKRYEQTQQNKRDIELTKYNLLKNINLLHFYLRDLAYLKVDTNLQNYYATTEKDIDFKKRAQEESYANYKHISEKEEKISILYSELYCDIIKYFKLTRNPLPADAVNYFNGLRISLLNLDKAPEISKEDVGGEIADLTTKYLNKLIDIKNLIEKLS